MTLLQTAPGQSGNGSRRAATVEAMSPNTRRTYSRYWLRWQSWAGARKLPDLPAQPEHLEIWPESGGSRVSGYTWSQQA